MFRNCPQRRINSTLARVFLSFPIALLAPSACAQSCDALLLKDHGANFESFRNTVQSAASLAELASFRTESMMSGVKLRDLALACRQEKTGDVRKTFWNISYAYRVLADTLRPLDVPSNDGQLELFRKEILERIEFAADNLDRP